VSASYEDAATSARAGMVERLRGAGISEPTLAAFARVPRHRMVPHFWTLPTVIAGMRTKPVEHREGDLASLRVLHDNDRALAVNRVPSAAGGTTSTASAPQLLAIQADQLALAPGMTVLEIGTGPGYFAAVLSELVGPSGRVVSIDIDEEVAAGAATRLDALGYANVTVLARDGDAGAPERAPFDRVVGSVGCNDVAAAWLRQLGPNGFALVPLLHGALHPMIRLDASGAGRIVTRSGYVAIQGRQSQVRLWPHARDAVAATTRAALPSELAAALTVAPGRERIGGLGEWDLGYWVAAADQRAGSLAELNDGAGSSARIAGAAGSVAWAGPHGRELAFDLVAYARAWLAAGRPTVEDHTHRFVPITEASPTAEPGRRAVVARVDHHQVITLAAGDR
jgi:protein-L-isoaspartate(D-aspartate) O-methyltransferase